MQWDDPADIDGHLQWFHCKLRHHRRKNCFKLDFRPAFECTQPQHVVELAEAGRIAETLTPMEVEPSDCGAPSDNPLIVCQTCMHGMHEQCIEQRGGRVDDPDIWQCFTCTEIAAQQQPTGCRVASAPFSYTPVAQPREPMERSVEELTKTVIRPETWKKNSRASRDHKKVEPVWANVVCGVQNCTFGCNLISADPTQMKSVYDTIEGYKTVGELWKCYLRENESQNYAAYIAFKPVANARKPSPWFPGLMKRKPGRDYSSLPKPTVSYEYYKAQFNKYNLAFKHIAEDQCRECNDFMNRCRQARANGSQDRVAIDARLQPIMDEWIEHKQEADIGYHFRAEHAEHSQKSLLPQELARINEVADGTRSRRDIAQQGRG
eukprot:COSAG01_NODE_3843_length_5645_cov_22.311756_2_plen_378_part_00